MSDNGEEDADEPVVELGDGDDVEGAPISRVASRLFFPIEKSEIVRREGDATIRTPDGAQSVKDVLGRSDEVYFETNQDFVGAVRSAVGTGPAPTAGGSSGSSTSSGSGDADAAGTTDDGGAASEDEEGEFEFADE